MRKFFKASVPFLIVLVSMFSFVPFASAHANGHSTIKQSTSIQAQKVTPQDSGAGGCSSDTTNGVGDVTGRACISYQWVPQQVFPDGYVSFHKIGHGGVSGCTVRIELYEGSTYITRDQYNCSVQAASGQAGVHFGPTGHSACSCTEWYSLLKVNMSYNDGTFTAFTSLLSPGVLPF